VAIPSSVILTLVVGIQRPDVRRVKRLFQLKDLSWLDASHKGEHEGGNQVPKTTNNQMRAANP